MFRTQSSCSLLMLWMEPEREIVSSCREENSLESQGHCTANAILLSSFQSPLPVGYRAAFWTKDNPRPGLLARLMTMTLHLFSSYLFLLVSAESPPPPPPNNTNAPTPGSNPAVMMSAVWVLCYGGYVITPAYLLFDSLRPLAVKISCYSSPHVQSVLHPWFNMFLSSCELEKMDVSTLPLFPGNSIFPPHIHSLALSLAFSHHLF